MWPVLGICVLILVPLALSDVSPGWVLFGVAVTAIVLAAGIVFGKLRVTVCDGRIAAAFGFGHPRRELLLADVVAARHVRSRWWHGWGLRWIPGGTMYNVWGFDAVEFELPDGKIFRIGTDEPEELLAVVSPRIGGSSWAV